MNAYQLWKTVPGTKWTPLPLWVCGECGIIHRGDIYGQKKEDWSEMSRKSAERCCKPIICNICGLPVPTIKRETYTECPMHHDECRHKRDAEREKELMEKAEKLETWDGWVFYDGPGSPYDGQFACNIEEIMDSIKEAIEDEDNEMTEADRPEYAFVCKSVHPVPLDIQDYYERVDDVACTENGYDNLAGTAELEKAIAEFNELNKNVGIALEPDYKRAVKIPWKNISEGA